MSSSRSFVWIKRFVTPNEADLVREASLEGVSLLPEHTRVYPNRSLGSQVVGFAGIDGQGLEGLEYYYNQYLKGATVKHTVMQGCAGKAF